MLKPRAYVNCILFGATRKTSAPHPLSLEDPSTNMVHQEWPFKFEIMGGVTVCHFIAILDSKPILYSLNYIAYLINCPNVLGLWKTCLRGRLVSTVIE